MTLRSIGTALLAAGLVLAAAAAGADRVTPSERVKSRLNVRAEPKAGSRVVGRLLLGEQLELPMRTGFHRAKPALHEAHHLE